MKKQSPFQNNYAIAFFNENFICQKNGHFYHNRRMNGPIWLNLKRVAGSQLHIYTVTILFVLCKVLKILSVILLPAHPASFALKFLFQRVLASPGMQ